MSESTLAFTHADCLVAVGEHRGYGTDSTAWDAAKASLVERIVRAGYRKVVFPPPLPNERSSHAWSFLKPSRTFSIQSGIEDNPLPDDFGYAVGEIFFEGSSTTLGTPLPLTDEPRVLARRSESPDATGKPQLAAVRARKGTGATHSHRYELMVWPVPDADYEVRLRYSVLPNAMTSTLQHHMGGAWLSETVRLACLAASEEHDDVLGVNAQLFMQQLAAAVAYDRRNTGQHLGYCGNGAGRWSDRQDPVRLPFSVTVNGVQY